MIPPLLVLELLMIRFLMADLGRPFRSNIIAVLKKTKVDVIVEASSFFGKLRSYRKARGVPQVKKFPNSVESLKSV